MLTSKPLRLSQDCCFFARGGTSLLPLRRLQSSKQTGANRYAGPHMLSFADRAAMYGAIASGYSAAGTNAPSGAVYESCADASPHATQQQQLPRVHQRTLADRCVHTFRCVSSYVKWHQSQLLAAHRDTHDRAQHVATPF